MTDSNIALWLFLLLPSLFFSACGSTTRLTSDWENNNSITIDGDSGKWTNLQTIGDSPVALGFRNDGEFIYICLTTTDPQVRRQILGLGLTVWVESDDSKIGIRYPLGRTVDGRRPGFGGESPERPSDAVLQTMNDIEILGPRDNERSRFTTLDVPGIKATIHNSQSELTYELKIPLQRSRDYPYALSANPGSDVRIEIKTGEPRFADREFTRGGGREDGRMPPGGGMPGGRVPGRGRPRGERMERPTPLDISADVHLASPKVQ